MCRLQKSARCSRFHYRLLYCNSPLRLPFRWLSALSHRHLLSAYKQFRLRQARLISIMIYLVSQLNRAMNSVNLIANKRKANTASTTRGITAPFSFSIVLVSPAFDFVCRQSKGTNLCLCPLIAPPSRGGRDDNNYCAVTVQVEPL